MWENRVADNRETNWGIVFFLFLGNKNGKCEA